MAPPHTARLVSGALGDAEVRAVRALLDVAFGEAFSDDDWHHALGGVHAVLEHDGEVLAHGALVPRTLHVEGRPVRTGYVEAVAVRPEQQRRGLGHAVMAALERAGAAYDLLALSASEAGLPLYAARGWRVWQGPTGVRGGERTPDDDGAVLVLGWAGTTDGLLECDPRPGDVW